MNKKVKIGLLVACLIIITAVQDFSQEIVDDILKKIDIYGAGTIGPGELEKDTAVLWKNNVIEKYSPTGSRVSGIFRYKKDIYISGYYEKDRRVIPCYWKNGKLVELPALSDKAFTSSIYVVGDDVYVSGHYLDDKGKVQPCYWKNNNRIDLFKEQNESSYTRKILVSDKDIYVIGFRSFYRDEETKFEACYWKNGKRSILNSEPYIASIAFDIVSNGKDVFILGRLDGTKFIPGRLVDTIKQYLCYWVDDRRTDLAQVNKDLRKEILGIVITYESADYFPLSKDYKIIAPAVHSSLLYINNNDLYIAGTVGDSIYLWKNNIKYDLTKLGLERVYSIFSIKDDVLIVGSNKDNILIVYKDNVIKTFPKGKFRPEYFLVDFKD